MPKVDVDFQIQERGAAQTKAKVDDLTRSTEKLGSKLPRVSEGLSRVASSVMGPLGVATALAAASERLIAFGRENVTTEKQAAEFDKLTASVNATKQRLGEATAAALTNSNVLELVGTGVDMLALQFEPLLKLVGAAGPYFDFLGMQIEAMAAPVRWLGDGIEWLGEATGIASDESEELAGELGDLGSEADKAAQALLGLAGVMSDIERMRADTVARRQVAANAATAEGLAAAKAAEAEAKAQREMALAVDVVSKAKGNVTYAKANRDELASAEKLLKTESEKAALAASSATATLDQVNNYQQLATLYEDAVAVNEKLAKLEERKASAVKEQVFGYEQQNNLIGALIAGASQGEVGEQTVARRQRQFAAEMRELDKLIKMKEKETKIAAKSAEENEKARAEATMLEKVRTQSLMAEASAWIGVGDAAVGMVGKVADVGVAHAVLAVAKAATELPALLAVGDYPGAALMGISAANAIIEQATAESMGGKKKGAASSAGASSASAASASVAPPSDLDRGGRGGDLTAVITVGNRAFGELAISSANAAARSGGQKLDRRVLGSSTRRGRITP